MTKYQCKNCGWIGQEDDILKKRAYFETQYEPEEWLWYCPECNSTKVEESPTAWCSECGDVPVGDEGERCSECITCNLERIADAARGH